MSGISTGVLTGDRKAIKRALNQYRDKSRKRQAGLVQVCVWVNAAQAADLKEACKVLKQEPYWGIGPLRDEKQVLKSWKNYEPDE